MKVFRWLVLASVVSAFLFLAVSVAPAPVFAGAIDCTADPAVVVLGERINITCTGFDRDTIVNSYVVESTGFAEIGKDNYAACLTSSRGEGGPAFKTDETGTVVLYWYTQDGTGDCGPNRQDYYDGYANQIGTYTVVVHELGPARSIKYAGKVDVTLMGPSLVLGGASLQVPASAFAGEQLTISGWGYVPGEMVSVWFTRPANCSGMGWWFYTGPSAFDPTQWDGAGVSGPGNVKAGEGGAFSATYQLGTPKDNNYPCLGEWTVSARALGSGRGAEASFQINGHSVDNNALVWVLEDSVFSEGNAQCDFGDVCGITVHVSGSGFPAGSRLNCWMARPDGTAYTAYNPFGNEAFSVLVGPGGTFSGVPTTWTAEKSWQGEQLGRWGLSCGTPDGEYVGTDYFDVFGAPFVDP